MHKKKDIPAPAIEADQLCTRESPRHHRLGKKKANRPCCTRGALQLGTKPTVLRTKTRLLPTRITYLNLNNGSYVWVRQETVGVKHPAGRQTLCKLLAAVRIRRLRGRGHLNAVCNRRHRSTLSSFFYAVHLQGQSQTSVRILHRSLRHTTAIHILQIGYTPTDRER